MTLSRKVHVAIVKRSLMLRDQIAFEHRLQKLTPLDFRIRDAQGNTLLHNATHVNNARAVNLILQRSTADPVVVNSRNDFDETALMMSWSRVESLLLEQCSQDLVSYLLICAILERADACPCGVKVSMQTKLRLYREFL